MNRPTACCPTKFFKAFERLDVLQANIKEAEVVLSKTPSRKEAKVRQRISRSATNAGNGVRTAELVAAEGLLEGDFKENYMRLSRAWVSIYSVPVETRPAEVDDYQTLTAHIIH